MSLPFIPQLLRGSSVFVLQPELRQGLTHCLCQRKRRRYDDHMHRWPRLNDRQLALLTRIGEGTDPVTSDSPDLARTAQVLKERGLITMPKEGGRWKAEIAEAGRFYLQHGHHPDRPEPTPRTTAAATAPREPESPEPETPAEPKPRVQRVPKVRQPSSADIGAALIAEVQAAGRFLRIRIRVMPSELRTDGRSMRRGSALLPGTT